MDTGVEEHPPKTTHTEDHEVEVHHINEERFYRTKNGIDLPSVTTILGPQYPQIVTRRDTQYYLDRGTYIHKALERLELGTLDFNKIPDDARPFIAAYESFLADTLPTILEVETVVINRKFGYGGRKDRVFRLGRGLSPVLVDFKSGGLTHMAALQTAAYAMGDINLNRAVLLLRKDGTYRFHRFLKRHNARHWRLFLLALEMHRFKQEQLVTI